MADPVSSEYLEFDEAQNLAADMNELAERLAGQDDVTAWRLKQLGQTLTGAQSAQLSSLDVGFALDPLRVEQRIMGQSKRVPLFLGVMEVVRNVLVLVPLVVTWISLANATQLYGKVLEQHPELAEKSFLAMWQEGFKALGNPSGTFSDMARLDFWLLVAVIAVAFIVHVMRDLLGARQELAASQLANEVEVIGWRLNRFLAAMRNRQASAATQATQVAVERFDANARALGDLFRVEHTRAEQMTLSQEKVVSELSAFTSKFQLAANSLQRHQDGLQGAYQGLNGTVEKLALLVSRQEQRQENLLKNLESVLTRTGDMVSSTTEFRDDVRRAVEALRVEVGHAAASSATLAGAAVQMKDFGVTLANNEETVRRTLTDFPNSVQRMIEEQGKGAERLVKTLESFGSELRTRASELSSGEKALLGSFEAWQKQVGNTERTSADIAVKLEQALRELHDQVKTSNERIDAVATVTENLRGQAQSLSSNHSEVARTLQDTRQANQTLLDNFKRDVKSLSEDLKTTVGSLSKHAADMTSGQTKLEQALTGVGRQLGELSEQAKGSSEALSAASRELTTAANNVLTGETQRQSHSVNIQNATKSLDATSKSLQLTVEAINRSMQDVVRAASLTGQEAEAVKQALDELAKESVRQSRQNVTELKESRDAMEKTVGVINRLPSVFDELVTKIQELADNNAQIGQELARIPERLESIALRSTVAAQETLAEVSGAQPIAGAASTSSRNGGRRLFGR